MTYLAEIIDGVVERVIVVDPENIPEDFAGWPEAGPHVAPGWTWDGVMFARPVVVITPAEVKAEAARRILAMAPEWRQRNAAQRMIILALARQDRDLSAEEQAEVVSIGEMWVGIEVIRAASDAIEAMDPIPADFAENTYWPEA